MKTLLSTSIVCLLGLALVGCGKETDADKIADAQYCLDYSDSTNVDQCLTKIEGLQSEGANLIRCGAAFIKEGYSSPTKLSTALTNISSGSGGSSGAATTAVIAALAFTTKSNATDNATFALDTYNTCVKSKSNGLILLAGLSLTSTTLWSLGLSGSSTPPTAAQLQTLMGTLASNPSAAATVGDAAVTMYQTNCATSNSAPGSMCAQFQSAVNTVPGGTSNPSGVGTQLLTCYSNPNASGCSSF
jgi:hypothetical protein